MSEIIWTNHAKERNKERQISQKWVEETVINPDKTIKNEAGKLELKKEFGNFTVTVITTTSTEGKYLILSSWINPPIPGTIDYKNRSYFKKLRKAGNLKKFWLTFIHQFGL